MWILVKVILVFEKILVSLEGKFCIGLLLRINKVINRLVRSIGIYVGVVVFQGMIYFFVCLGVQVIIGEDDVVGSFEV